MLSLKDLGILKTRRVRGGVATKLRSAHIPVIFGRIRTYYACVLQKLFAYYRNVNKCNLTSINSDIPSATNSRPTVSMCLMNARSIISKTEPFLAFACENRPDFISVTKTWLSANDQGLVSRK